MALVAPQHCAVFRCQSGVKLPDTPYVAPVWASSCPSRWHKERYAFTVGRFKNQI